MSHYGRAGANLLSQFNAILIFTSRYFQGDPVSSLQQGVCIFSVLFGDSLQGDYAGALLFRSLFFLLVFLLRGAFAIASRAFRFGTVRVIRGSRLWVLLALILLALLLLVLALLFPLLGR